MIRNDKPNVIVDKTIAFSLVLIEYCEKLEQDKITQEEKERAKQTDRKLKIYSNTLKRI